MDEQKNKSGKIIWKVFILSIIMGLLFILIYEGISGSNEIKIENIGIQLMVAGSSFATGALLGFLFGIPRLIDTNNIDSEHRIKKFIGQNDNLVQISDWLTKIIVGVGLTNLNNIPTYFLKLGNYYSNSFSSNLQIGANAAIATIVYFIIIGFLSCYLWTRLYLAEMFDNVEGALTKLIKLSNKVDSMEKNIIDTNQSLGKIIEKMPAIKYIGDPNKGKFGSTSLNNHREISAIIEKADNPFEFRAIITVKSLDINNPLTGSVVFHLHPMINNHKRQVDVEDGIAKLVLDPIHGAFTIGAIIDDGKTKLELDLRNVKNLPHNFT